MSARPTLRPELAELLAGVNAEMARLRKCVELFGAVMDTRNLLTLAEAYAGHTGLSLSTISTYAANAGVFFKNISSGAGCTVKTYDRVLTWFDRNWPTDLDWPQSVPRPAPSTAKSDTKRGAA